MNALSPDNIALAKRLHDVALAHIALSLACTMEEVRAVVTPPPGSTAAQIEALRKAQDDLARAGVIHTNSAPTDPVEVDAGRAGAIPAPPATETAPSSESHEGQDAQERMPESDGRSEDSASPLQWSSGADAQLPDSLQAEPASSRRAGAPLPPETVAQTGAGDEDPLSGSSQAGGGSIETQAPPRKTRKQKVAQLHGAHPDWTAPQIAAEIGCSRGAVYNDASDLGIILPKAVVGRRPANAPGAVRVASAPPVVTVLPAMTSWTLTDRVRRLHTTHPTWTGRMIATELGAKEGSVSTILATIRKEAPPADPPPEFSSADEMRAHYAQVKKRLGVREPKL